MKKPEKDFETSDQNADLSELGAARRKFLGQLSTTAAALLAANLISEQQALAFDEIFADSVIEAAVTDENALTVKLSVNGAEQTVTLDSRVTLLDALRERLGLDRLEKRLRPRAMRRLHGDR